MEYKTQKDNDREDYKLRGGVKTGEENRRKCLNCDKWFDSKSKINRLCDNCKTR